MAFTTPKQSRRSNTIQIMPKVKLVHISLNKNSYIELELNASLDAHHLIAEGTVDVLAAALQGRVVGRVHRVDRHGPTPAPVEGVQLDVAGPHLPRGRRHGGGGCSGCTGSRLRHADGMGGGGEACVGAPPSHGLLLRRVLPGGRLGSNSIAMDCDCFH